MAMPSTTTTTTTTESAHKEELYKYPPFPALPAGAAIVPFSAFAPAGYQCATGPSGDPIEVDAWAGIQTIKVLNEEEAAQRRRARRKRRNAGTTVDLEGRLIPWWEEWEEGEAQRAMSETAFHNHMTFEDRVCLAADDFRVGRIWPEIAQGVRYMWDQFRLYIGLVSSIPVYKRIKMKPRGQVDGPNNGGEASDEEEDVPRAKCTKVDIVQDYLEQNALPGKQLEPVPDRDGSTVEAQRLRAFLGDMEKAVKMFLSSYMRDTGLIWTEKNLFVAPTVLHFFLRFLLRNNVFADSAEHLNNLGRALSVAALAQKELPTTAKLGQMLPGQFDIACREYWGTQGSLSIQISATISPVDTPINGAARTSDTNSAFEAELMENDIEVVPSNMVLDSITARQVMEDNLDTDHQVPVTTIPVATNPWTAAIRAEDYTTASWTDVSVPWLMQLLGPSVFPLTMKTGIIEFSTRRVRDVIGPGVRSRKLSIVEEVLEERFFRVVMSPWLKSASEETADFPRPMITRGAVIADGVDEGEDVWNPYRDDVTILVSEEVAGKLMVGMGLSGTWVQMVANQRYGMECYWYVESLVATFTSYYMEGETIGAVLEE